MTKKHYEAIAGIIKDLSVMNNELQKTGKAYRKDALKATASELETYFGTDNKNFDRTRFLAACGIDQ